MFAEELQEMFKNHNDHEYIKKFIGGYVAGYATYRSRLQETFIQVYVDPRKMDNRRYTFSVGDISAPVMRLDYSIEDEKLYNAEYDIEAALTEMGRRIKEDLDRFEDKGYEL